MKNLLPTICLLFVLASSCEEAKKSCSNPLSACLEEKITQFKSDSRSIALLSTELNGKCVYLFSTEAPMADGTDDVLDADCKVVCSVGGFRPNQYDCNGTNLQELPFDTLWHR